MYDVDKVYQYAELDDVTRLLEIRDMFANLAAFVQNSLPESREKSLALTSLEQAWHWADRAACDYQELIERGL
ncbi:hypothetical protein SEA_STEPHIG9_51 [Mycobacterium phage Stephig9]|uniref:Acb2/Tad1 hairpin domain-containing protein n=1 Tax=Mycobacterium phage Stephig9 TaxID=2591224 RepID=A0A514DHA2_9CAUD|nr:hypothetical protein SEA_STEPHIG9_51 [Mycobacterium phage Stephig9]